MARGPMAKHPSARARSNKTSTAAMLVPVDRDSVVLPPLPEKRFQTKEGELVKVEWHDQAKLAWAEVWSSPMVPEYLDADLPLLHAYVASVDNYWARFETGRSFTEAGKLMLSFAERFGIGPDSRRRLQWTVEQAENAMARGEQRRRDVEQPQSIDSTAAWDALGDDDITEAEVVE